jgi:uncharacterized protein (DUF342 family)
MGETIRSNAGGFSSDLTRKLVDDAEMLTRMPPSEAAFASQDEQATLAQLVQQFETLDKETQRHLTELASLATEEWAQQLRIAICHPGRAAISVSADLLEAYLDIFPPTGGGKALATSDVMDLLRAEGITFGVDIRAISRLVDEAAHGRPARDVIARGKSCVDGEAGYIEVIAGEPVPSAGAGKKLQQWMAKRGDLLARIVAPTHGSNGTDVYGRPIPPAVGDAATVAIAGEIAFADAEQGYVAGIDGLAVFDGVTLEMRRQIIWVGDFTLNDRAINFSGKVLIRGTIRDGAQVTATEDIEVTGGIEGATVTSTGGSISVKQGITGRHRAFVSAFKGIDVRYIENATVYCAGEIVVRHAVIRSKLSAGESIRVDMGKGVIFGGDTRAGKSVTAISLGNIAGIATRISVGHTWAAMEKLAAQEAGLVALSQQIAQCADLIQRFQRARPDAAMLSERERRSYSAVLLRHLVLKKQMATKCEEFERLDTSTALDGTGEVICREAVFPGTSIKIGAAQAHVGVNLPACRFRLQKDGRHIEAVSTSGRHINL